MSNKNLTQHCNEILVDVRMNNFAGYDPFDGLNSRFFECFPRLKTGIFGLVWTQFNKRSIVNMRPLLGIPKGRNPKGVALFILGLLEDYHRSLDETFLNEAISLGDWLITQQSNRSEWASACWGYHFDWNARAFYVPKGKPNIITTIYVAQALFALYHVTNDEKYRSISLEAADFIVNTLHVSSGEKDYFAYIPGEDAFVHNASLWGAAWVAVVAAETNNKLYADLALRVARSSAYAQNEDGSWVYGTRHHHVFVDGFHTGYNLEALHILREALKVTEFDAIIDKGFAFYKSHLFEPDGTAKYYDTNKYPLDMHCVSQAIFTFDKLATSDTDKAFINKVISRSIELLYDDSKGQFLYQRNSHIKNKINYIRWTQAWVYYSFAYFNNRGDK